jgi:hypothetical protein
VVTGKYTPPPRVGALMDRTESWKKTFDLDSDGNVVTVEMSDYLLKHENGHLRISHMFAKRLNDEIASIRVAFVFKCNGSEVTADEQKTAMKNAKTMLHNRAVAVFNAFRAGLDNAQILYDSKDETDHARDETRQAAWNNYSPTVFEIGPKLKRPN